MSQKDWERIKQIIVTELILQHNKHTKMGLSPTLQGILVQQARVNASNARQSV